MYMKLLVLFVLFLATPAPLFYAFKNFLYLPTQLILFPSENLYLGEDNPRKDQRTADVSADGHGLP